MRYEHDALVREIIARMNPHHQDEEEAAAAAEAAEAAADEAAVGGAKEGVRLPPPLPRMMSLESTPRSPRHDDDDGAIVAQLRAQVEFQRSANAVLRREVGASSGGAGGGGVGGGATRAPVVAAALDTTHGSCSCYALRAAVHALAREHKALSAKKERSVFAKGAFRVRGTTPLSAKAAETKKAAVASTMAPQSELQRELAAARAANAQLQKRVAELEASAAMRRLSLHT